jgi:16S rRNA (guanine527-N7)-methyltransferase
MGIDTESLRSGAAAFGVSLTDTQTQQFARYAELLEDWNRSLNLTRVSPADVVPLHFLDSLTLAGAIDLSPPFRLIDVGSGAGFPGLALKIAFPALDVTLLDATRKRLAFLDAVITDLSLQDVRTIHSRAEDAGRDRNHRQHYDVVTARAVSRLHMLAELLIPLARIGGHVAAMKSADIDDELAESVTAVSALGGATPRIISLTLPGTDITRKLVVIDKIRPTLPAYPRDSSQVKSNPISNKSSCR